ncbi:MAG: GNAT family N-acetyltransferase [Rhodobiaceae bacterium]|nr:GNAT family N-acetyltransferase [Rhodobiaceae bacterium]
MTRPTATPTLKTRRLVLRAPGAPGDADRIFATMQDEEVVRWLARVPWPYERHHADGWVAGTADCAASGEEYAFAIDRGGLIGMITLRGDGPEMNTGYWLERASWGKGIMTEAAAAVIAFGFNTLGVEAVTSGIFEGNDASLALQRRLGFTETGKSMAHSLYYGRDLRHIDTRLTRETYENRNA